MCFVVVNLKFQLLASYRIREPSAVGAVVGIEV